MSFISTQCVYGHIECVLQERVNQIWVLTHQLISLLEGQGGPNKEICLLPLNICQITYCVLLGRALERRHWLVRA